MITYSNLSAIIFTTFFAALFGACFGSFLNVCVWRIPREESVVTPRSHCPSCGRLIPWYLNIPVFSWLMLRGKCKWCGSPIAFRYILLEILTAVLFVVPWFQALSSMLMPDCLYAEWSHYQGALSAMPETYWAGLVPIINLWLVPVYWLIIFGLLLGMFIDFEHYIIPDRVTWGGVILGFVISPLIPEIHFAGDWLTSLIRAAIGFAAGYGGLMLVAVLGKLAFKKEAMGYGDVKLMGAVGALFGWQAVLFTIFLSSLLGSVVGLSLICLKKKALQSQIPYGPYIAVAAMVWMFWGQTICSWYLSFLPVVE